MGEERATEGFHNVQRGSQAGAAPTDWWSGESLREEVPFELRRLRRSSAGGKRDKDLFRHMGRHVQRHRGPHVRTDKIMASALLYSQIGLGLPPRLASCATLDRTSVSASVPGTGQAHRK